jgi:hypothetical protein
MSDIEEARHWKRRREEQIRDWRTAEAAMTERLADLRAKALEHPWPAGIDIETYAKLKSQLAAVRELLADLVAGDPP